MPMVVLEKYGNLLINSTYGYADYLWKEVLNPHWTNFFYWLLALSLFCWLLEIIVPWRKGQPVLRRDFWLDGFYMFFNFFLFSLIGYNALSDVGVEAFKELMGRVGVQHLVVWDIAEWPVWARLLTLFVVRDFIQWNVHLLLHRVEWLWRIHQVHHSVEEMGFASHMRYHPMETVIYRALEYIPLAMIGFGLTDFFIVHLFTLAIGHLNHTNVYLPLGKLRYLLNNPQTHTWHHAKELKERRYGVNFAITLSLWDYLFGTAYVPKDGKDIALGFKGIEEFPRRFWKQLRYPFERM
ncbi:sterol desaturase family protein [Telluribacter humicola]|uniref:sterol desaturase family protein n=1 Tax=Telluribacter humicola TaxID=1720261 RepID=UPI001E435AB3|nr:sterol desaturase family protein [Telluribacter humicola]